tara:strand:- start:14754 stop:15884 length:1131 start_codon:yes stop_codon:yes gene_type:complete
MGHIDSIRGFAALLVVWMHTTAIFKSIQTPDGSGSQLYDVAYLFDFGRIGVIAFFAISGFVICPSLKGGRVAGSGKFVISRFFRLYPAFWASIICAILVLFVLPARKIDGAQVLGNITMFYSVFDVMPLQGLYWTLEVELVFYFLCLAMFLIGALHRPLAIFGACICLMSFQNFLSTDPELRQQITAMFSKSWPRMPWHLAIMFWGGLFRIWYDDRQRLVTIWRIRVPILLLVITALLLILIQPFMFIDRAIENGGGLKQYSGMLAYILGIFFFVTGALYLRVNNKFFVWLGAISYSLYLLHPIASQLLRTVIKNYFPDYVDLHLGVTLFLGIIFSIVISAIVYHLIEKPSIRWGRILQKKWHLPRTEREIDSLSA